MQGFCLTVILLTAQYSGRNIIVIWYFSWSHCIAVLDKEQNGGIKIVAVRGNTDIVYFSFFKKNSLVWSNLK